MVKSNKLIISISEKGKKNVNFELDKKEVEAALGLCERKRIERVFCMKKDGAAQLFSEKRSAIVCQERHDFEYMVSIDKDTLSNFLKE